LTFRVPLCPWCHPEFTTMAEIEETALARPIWQKFSVKQKAYADMLLRGKDQAEMSAAMEVSVQAVKHQISRMREIANARNTVHLAALLFEEKHAAELRQQATQVLPRVGSEQHR
jgi:DNA-binding CsgD family transcriptional regulator